MTTEDRLRRAIEARTSSVEPSTDGLAAIEEGLARSRRRDTRRRVLLGLGSAAAVVAVVVGVVAASSDDPAPVSADDSSTTSSSSTTSTTDPTTTSETTTTTTSTTVVTPSVDVAVPIWPRVHTALRFEDPVSAARSFAEDFVGMTDPVVGPFEAGDARSGEVSVQPVLQAPVTTVFVRQLEDHQWFVIGASTADLRLDTPTAGTRIECPARLTGEALAFEGVVHVSVRADWSDEPIGTGTVQGGGGPAAPFDGNVACNLDTLDDGLHYGAIVLYTVGGEDYRVWTATVVRVALK
jgi:hypothetical protein